VATTEVEGDIDGGVPRVCYQELQQRPPPKLKETSIAGPLGVPGAPAVASTEVEGDVDGRLPGRCLLLSSITIRSGFCKKDVGGNK
jgi:hypothetical protein